MRRNSGRSLEMAVIVSICGCSLIPAANQSNLNKQQVAANRLVNKVDSSPFFLNNNVRELEVHELKPGQQVQLVTASETDRASGQVATITTQLAGTICSVDSEHIVVRDTVKIFSGSQVTAVPIVNRVPYFSRLFKNTGVAWETTAIPGEVWIRRSEILLVGELPQDDTWPLDQTRKFERIGVDFDVSGNPVDPAFRHPNPDSDYH